MVSSSWFYSFLLWPCRLFARFILILLMLQMSPWYCMLFSVSFFFLQYFVSTFKFKPFLKYMKIIKFWILTYILPLSIINQALLLIVTIFYQFFEMSYVNCCHLWTRQIDFFIFSMFMFVIVVKPNLFSFTKLKQRSTDTR